MLPHTVHTAFNISYHKSIQNCQHKIIHNFTIAIEWEYEVQVVRVGFIYIKAFTRAGTKKNCVETDKNTKALWEKEEGRHKQDGDDVHSFT